MIDGTQELKTALDVLDKLMTKDNDGSGYVGSLKKLLEDHNVPNAALVARTLTNKGIIQMDGTKRKPVYYWGINSRPSTAMCEGILLESREKRHGNFTKNQKDITLLDKLKFSQSMGMEIIDIKLLIKYLEDENS